MQGGGEGAALSQIRTSKKKEREKKGEKTRNYTLL